MKILLTGATGFIGSKLLNILAKNVEAIYITIRPKSVKAAKDKFSDFPNIYVVEADITEEKVILDKSFCDDIYENVDTLIHGAALYDLKISFEDSYFTNIIGTQNVCSLGKKIKNLKYFHLISSIAVSGLREGNVFESELDEHARFGNDYAKTKMNAEQIFRRCNLENVRKRVYRPGIVIGNTETGLFEKIDGPYYFLKLLYELNNKTSFLKKSPALFFPYNKDIFLPIIPIDYLTKWLKEMIVNPSIHDELRTYHLLEANHVKLDEFLKAALKFIGSDCRIIPLKRKSFFSSLIKIVGIPKETLDYMYLDTYYDCAQRIEDFPDLKIPTFSSYQNNVFQAAKTSFRGSMQ